MSAPTYLVKAVFKDKLKIFQLPDPTMDSLWSKVESAFGVTDGRSSLQGQYVDKDGESIFLDTDEELVLAFAICDVPLRINLVPCATAPTAEPVAVPVASRNDAKAKSSNFVDEEGCVRAMKVTESSSDDSSSDSSDDDLEVISWKEILPDDVVSRVTQNLAAAGISVSSGDLQGFCRVLQVPLDRIDKPEKRGSSAPFIKKMTKIVAGSDRREEMLKAKFEKFDQKLKAKTTKLESTTGSSSSENDTLIFGEWWNVEEGGNTASDRPRGPKCSKARKLVRLRRKLTWPSFWRQILLRHGVDIEATAIRRLSAVFKIRKGRIFRKGLASREEFRAFCRNSKEESNASAPFPGVSQGATAPSKGKGRRSFKGHHGRWKGKGRGGGWKGHCEFDEFEFQHDDFEHFPPHGHPSHEAFHDGFHDFPLKGGCKGKGWGHFKGKGKGEWHFKGKGKVDHFHHRDMWAMEKGKGKGKGGMRPYVRHNGGGRGCGFDGHEDRGTQNTIVHNNVTCDGCGMSPIKGMRYHLEGRNYDLCEADYAQLTDAEKVKFVACSASNGPGDDRHPHVWGEESGEGGKCLARFVSHVTIPDGTIVEAGTSFLKIWSVRNDGNQPWPTRCELVAVGGGGGKGKGSGRRHEDDRGAVENADGNPTKLARGAAFSIPHSAVLPSKEVSIALDFRAPKEPGLYQVFFRLRDAAHGKKFGQRLWFSIMVKEKVTSMDGIDLAWTTVGSRKNL